MTLTPDTRSPRPILCIVGPTGSGKSELAQVVACAHDGEIVSADSMQIYRGMDIGTGKVLARDRRVPHFGLDIVDPGEAYSASLFQAYARTCFSEISARGKLPILCGGTGFYVRAAIDDYQFPKGDQVENPVRARYLRMAEEEGGAAVWEELDRLDHRSALAVHPNNVKRVIRALEMHFEGVSYADQVEKLKALPQAVPAIMVGLEVERIVLYERINARVDAMVADGLVEEVSALLNKGYYEGLTAQQAIGYKEIVAHLEGTCSLDEAIESIKQSTRRYAKRQISWFKSDPRITWVDATSYDVERLGREAWLAWLEGAAEHERQE